MQTIKLLVYPALAKPNSFIVASGQTGQLLSVHGRFNNNEPTQYFPSEVQAKQYTLSLPQECRQYQFIN